MDIGIIGLGLIGGSMAKAFVSYTDYNVFGLDCDGEITQRAMTDGMIKGELTDEKIRQCKLIILCVYPEAAAELVRQKAHLIKSDCVLTDCCGIKGYICSQITPIAKQKGFCYIGGHPMAGLAKVGYGSSTSELFKGASMILTPDENAPKDKINWLGWIFSQIGFDRIVTATPEQHDREIAYTSQLAHILSNAYVKSDSALLHSGFSAGSFKDLTRVAWLNEVMWTELFLENRKPLLEELDTLIGNLVDIKNALQEQNADELQGLLRQGREQKERVDRL